MKKNALQEARQSTNSLGVKLILVGFMAIFLMGVVSADTDALILPTQTGGTGGVTNPAGYIVNVSVAGGTNITAVTKSSASTGTTASVYVQTVGNTGVLLGNATFSGDNATFSPVININQSYRYFVVVGTPSGTYTRSENATSPAPLFPISNTQINTSWDIRLNTAIFNDQSENVLYIFTDNATVLTTPSVELISPAEATNFTEITNYFVANVTESAGGGILNVSLLFNGTVNQTNTSGFSGVYYNFSVAAPDGDFNWSIRAYSTTPTINNSETRNITINRSFFVTNTFTFFALEQSTQDFYINITTRTGINISSVNITYNQTNYTGTFVSANSTYQNLTATITLPSVTADINKTFNWTVFFTDGTQVRSSNFQQRVQNLGVDDCAVNTIMIFNFTMRDEDNQGNMSNTDLNTTIKIDLNMYPNVSKTTPTITFSQLYTETNPARVCISSTLGSTIFYIDTQVQYEADTYSREYYNIQNYSLNASSNPSQNITLFDLATNNSQNFTITYKDSSFLPVSNALIQVQRKYVDEGVFKIVEIPLTSAQGIATASLATNNIIYSFTVVKNGAVLATFSNVYAVCQNPSIENCEINLNSFSSTIPASNFSSTSDFMYTLTYNNNTRTVSSTFTVPSGAAAWISLNVTQEDALGTSVCNSSVTSSAGTLNCALGSTFGNSTVIAKLYKAGVLVGQGQIKLDQEPADIYGGVLVALGLFVMLTLIGAGLSDNPVFTVIFFIVGVILLFALNLVANNGFTGYTATILFLIIAIIIVIVKGANRT